MSEMTSFLYRTEQMPPEAILSDYGPSGELSEREYWDRMSHWITRERKRCKIPACRLAALLGVHRNTFSLWEKTHKKINAYQFQHLRRIFGQEINTGRAGTAVDSGVSKHKKNMAPAYEHRFHRKLVQRQDAPDEVRKARLC